MKSTEMAHELVRGSVLTRDSWNEDECIFLVMGELLKPTFYKHYGMGTDNVSINDVVCHSNSHNVSLGWAPSIEDLNATDWLVVDTVV
jgi:hypothetical protein